MTEPSNYGFVWPWQPPRGADILFDSLPQRAASAGRLTVAMLEVRIPGPGCQGSVVAGYLLTSATHAEG